MSVQDFRKILEVKRYSLNTIGVYCSVVKLTENYFERSLKKVSETDLHEFIYHLIHKKKISYSYQKQIVLALKLYYKEVYREEINVQFLVPKRKPFVVPIILSKKEIKHVIENIENIKHQSMIALMYSAGLRVGELLALTITDIDSSRMIITVRGGKGNKDRNLQLSYKVLVYLRSYYKKYKPKSYLFEGPKRTKYSNASVNSVFKKALKKVGIEKNLSTHALRHSYATHLLESGTDIRMIQELLGHNSIKTTMIYTHIAQPKLLAVASPFDD